MDINETEKTVEGFKKRDSAIAAAIWDDVNAQIPEEKERAARELRETAEAKKNLQSDYVDGRGQAIGSIPPIIYYRWHQLYPGCWQDPQFRDEFLADNPECALPGYRPKSKPVYFDMGRGGRVELAPGALKYHTLKGRVALDAAEIERRFNRMGLSFAAAHSQES